MDEYQRQEAIDMLIAQTDVDPELIEEYDDFGLEAWLGELGYEWDSKAGYGFGAWVYVDEAQP